MRRRRRLWWLFTTITIIITTTPISTSNRFRPKTRAANGSYSSTPQCDAGNSGRPMDEAANLLADFNPVLEPID
jgi:hypothetical protein